ncbi:MAG: pirin family protein [Rhodoferax sp.]
MKQVKSVYSAPPMHWVGDGFPVRSVFDYHHLGEALSPFLLLDYAAPTPFAPAARPRGVGAHPHRGFETVTLVFDGEVAHHDSTGQGGVIGPGDVQWMTAASGILHQEYHSDTFTAQGGLLHMVQLWVNLPAAHKMAPPGYQAITADCFPIVPLPAGAGTARVIAGSFCAAQGPAHTFSPLQVLDLHLPAGSQTQIDVQDGWTTLLVVLQGSMEINSSAHANAAQLVLFEPVGDQIAAAARSDTHALLLSGQPLGEPIAGHGPFVMNSRAEIMQAIDDFNHGRFGSL